jgi:hypothetical protein
MDSTNPQIILSISGHWLVGRVASRGMRLQDVLRDNDHTLISLHDVQVCCPMTDERRQVTISHTVINRREIEFAIVPHARHEAPLKRRDNYRPNETVDCLFSLHRYWIEGYVHVPTAHCNSALTFLHQLGNFFPVTDVRLKAVNVGQMRAPVLFANKRYVGAFSLRPTSVSDATERECTGTTDTTSSEMSTEVDWLFRLAESKQLADL